MIKEITAAGLEDFGGAKPDGKLIQIRYSAMRTLRNMINNETIPVNS